MAVSIPAVISTIYMNCTAPDAMPNKEKTDSVTVVGVAKFSLKPVTSGLEEFFRTDGKAEGLTYPVRSFTLPEEVDRGDFIGCSYVLLCDDISTWSDETTVQQRTQRLCKCMKAAFRVNADVCIGLIGDPSDFRSHVTTLCQDYPEFRWLLCSGRLINVVLKDDHWPLTATAVETLIAWLTVSGHTFEPQQLLDYRDMGQIIFRDLKEYVPEFLTFIRLGLLCLSGLLGILVTVMILTAITHEPSEERSIRGVQVFLRRTLERQRLGKCEWQPGDDAMALLALQLDQSDWCFNRVENQRTIDRMEIHLLATISRARHPTSRELTPVRLAQYINALLVVYLNPKDFHGHDLVSLLEAHVLRQGRRPGQRQGPFSRSLSIIALYNAKVTVDWGHLSGLMALQKEDGSFGYSIDETCLGIMALACARGESGVEEALNKSITWLAEKRTPEGAYGHTYSTALALQAFNVTGSRLPGDDWHVTMAWLLKQTTRDPAIRNIEIAAQVLLAISGRTLLSIRNFTGLGSGEREPSYVPRLLPHIYVDSNEGVPDKMQDVRGLEDTPPEGYSSEPELTKDPPDKATEDGGEGNTENESDDNDAVSEEVSVNDDVVSSDIVDKEENIVQDNGDVHQAESNNQSDDDQDLDKSKDLNDEEKEENGDGEADKDDDQDDDAEAGEEEEEDDEKDKDSEKDDDDNDDEKDHSS